MGNSTSEKCVYKPGQRVLARMAKGCKCVPATVLVARSNGSYDLKFGKDRILTIFTEDINPYECSNVNFADIPVEPKPTPLPNRQTNLKPVKLDTNADQHENKEKVNSAIKSLRENKSTSFAVPHVKEVKQSNIDGLKSVLHGFGGDFLCSQLIEKQYQLAQSQLEQILQNARPDFVPSDEKSDECRILSNVSNIEKESLSFRLKVHGDFKHGTQRYREYEEKLLREIAQVLHCHSELVRVKEYCEDGRIVTIEVSNGVLAMILAGRMAFQSLFTLKRQRQILQLSIGDEIMVLYGNEWQKATVTEVHQKLGEESMCVVQYLQTSEMSPFNSPRLRISSEMRYESRIRTKSESIVVECERVDDRSL